MTSDQITVSSGWSVKQKLAARLRAIGYTQQATSTQVGCALSTIQEWESKDEYQTYIQALHDKAWERIEPGIMANVALAVLVQRDMLNGDVKPDDKRYLEARRLIDRILDRLLIVEPPAASIDAPAPTQTVNVLIPGSSPS